MIPGVCQKNGITYRRFRIKKPDGRWGDLYVKLPDPTDPRFAEELALLNKQPPAREKGLPGSFKLLVEEFRPVLANRKMAVSTRQSWIYYLDLIETEHGHRVVADLRKSHVFKIRDKMGDTPGKANAYVSKLRALLDFATERDWIAVNPATGVGRLELGEYDPWPVEVLEAVLGKASPMLRLAIVTGLCSGQRLSDCIRMQHGWHDSHIMELRHKKTDAEAAVPMHPLWLAEIRKLPRKSVTILYDRAGKPFADTDRLQASIRRIMHELGFVDEEDQLLYTFHGLGKNACCYLTELGLSDREISAITGKTPETVRHYAKRARVLMVAKGAAERVQKGQIMGLVGKKSPTVGK
ncbi:tyrosine-type recombinase/integrase [Sphingomonas nostoxanthinifaciens]|uniref:tyrosine-type recombinase/integrase n=1 Tax=Sphingomonas nostoxanthinifaciens TaxID=2872652 RepID=UPI001CC1D4B8|nr:hypothetical protein [Sphingomonas nostoxanthinifaciens]